MNAILILISLALAQADSILTGRSSVSPAAGVAGEYGTWTVTYEVGEGGIAEGGGIRVQLPDAWHAGPRNSANRLQASDPAEDHYVSAQADRAGVRVVAVVENESEDTLVKHAKDSLDGRRERYVYVVRATVQEGSLRPGDKLRVVYGDTIGGSRGYRAGEVSAGPLPVLVAIDAEGTGDFILHSPSPEMTLKPGLPVALQFHAPSGAMVGEPMRLLISMLDSHDNPAHEYGKFELRVVEGAADVPETVTIPAGQGYVQFEGMPSETGILRIEAVCGQWVLSATSNPTEVTEEQPSAQIYWGDLHSHSHFSWDGVGYDNFDHARYVAGLDFYAMTDHSRTPEDGRTRGLSPATWEEYTALTERYYEPGEFVTLHAYECSFGQPYGHHNVYFRGEPGPLIAPENHTLPELWKALTEGLALTIPHHTGKFPDGVDFSIHDATFRRNFEIYSAHGLSEAYDPLHPLAFEHSDFTAPARSTKHPSHAQDAWRMGLEVSTVAASDDHRGHPGLPHWGLTAVFATELTRDGIFDALDRRVTYGTTGQKILLNFRVNGVPMGYSTGLRGKPEVYVRAVGTGAISRIEVLRSQAGDEEFKVIKTWNPDTLAFEEAFTDEDYAVPAIYYVRLRQGMPVRNRLVMAWSSPVWVR